VSGLLEREHELREVAELVDRARCGEGAVVVVEGPAGIGKTALLEEACGRAAKAGLAVLSARGAELERDFGFGIVRQLFEPVMRRASASNRAALLAGAAGFAAPVVNVVDGGVLGGAAPPADLVAVAHGLYWLTANLAEAGPLMLAVDDLHWSDPPSLRYLVYLAPRLEGLGALVVLTARPGEPGADTAGVSQIASARCARVVRPAALSEAAVSRLVRLGLQADAEVEFVRAVHGATGGIPFLAHELLYALAVDGVEPTSAAAKRVGELGPETVGRATLMRLSRLGQDAVAVARAVGVLGRDAAVARVARLAGVKHDDALREVDALAAVHILRPGRPVRFEHPILRAAVYDEMASGARSAAHERAACMLAEEGADASEIATHLLQTEPGGARS
jgi:predicted ATPase